MGALSYKECCTGSWFKWQVGTLERLSKKNIDLYGQGLFISLFLKGGDGRWFAIDDEFINKLGSVKKNIPRGIVSHLGDLVNAGAIQCETGTDKYLVKINDDWLIK